MAIGQLITLESLFYTKLDLTNAFFFPNLIYSKSILSEICLLSCPSKLLSIIGLKCEHFCSLCPSYVLNWINKHLLWVFWVVRFLLFLKLLILSFHFDLMQSVEEIYKVASISLSPNVPGQIFVSQVLDVLVRNRNLLTWFLCILNIGILSTISTPLENGPLSFTVLGT